MLRSPSRARAARRPAGARSRRRRAARAPARHPAGRKPPSLRTPDRGGEPRGLARLLVVAADQDDLLLAVGHPRELGAEARAQHRDRDRAGDVRLVELEVGAHVDQQRALAALRSTWRGASGRSSTPAVSSGPRLSSTIALKFGGCGPSSASARSTKSSSSSIVQQLVVAPLVADRRATTFMSIPGPPHIDPPRWPGQTSVSGGSASRRSCSERKMPRAPSSLSTARSGRAMSPTNSVSPVSTAHGSAPRCGVDERERGVLWAVARACASRGRVTQPSSSSQPSSNGSCVVVGLRASRWTWIVAPVAAASRPWPETWSAWLWVSSTCSMRTAHVAREREVLVDLEARVDDRRDARVLVADQVGRAAEVVVGDLAEDHGPTRHQRPAPAGGGRAPGRSGAVGTIYARRARAPRRARSAAATSGTWAGTSSSRRGASSWRAAAPPGRSSRR